MKITKNLLVDSIFDKTKIERRQVQKIVDCLLEEIKSNLSEGNSIELRGLGSFELRLRKARLKARNPKTGEQVSVKDRYTACFKPGKELKKNLLELPTDENL